jgi:transposase
MADFSFVGVDIASVSFTAAIGKAKKEQWQIVGKPVEFTNDVDGFTHYFHWLNENKAKPGKSIICMESTGVYGEALAYYLSSLNYRVVVEPPLKVKRAFHPVGHKNDSVDSCQIAEYAYRYQDELRVWLPKSQILEQIKVLLATREQLTVQCTAHRNSIKALKRKVVTTPLAEQVHEQSIQQIQGHIKDIDQEVNRLVDQDPDSRNLVTLLKSIPGVGPILSAHLLVLIKGSNQTYSPKQMAAFIGICPYEHRSGSSIAKTATSRHYGPEALRRLLYLASMSVRIHQPSFSSYFLRKSQQGKPRKVILNNIANKLVKIICAVVRSQTPYIQNYRSVNPLSLQKP